MAEAGAVFILAVDDDEIVRELVVGALEDNGYSVLAVASAKEALTVVYDRSSELGGIVTDVDLGPDQPTGWDVAHHAREQKPDIPVIYITGGVAEDWSANGVPHSVLIQKPFAPADLVVALAGLRKID